MNLPEFKSMVEKSGIDPLTLAVDISLWQDKNNSDEFPSVEELTGEPKISEFDAGLTDPNITMIRDKVAIKIFHDVNNIYLKGNFSKYRDLPMPFDQVNPDTQEIYTYDEWLDHNVLMYEKRHRELIEISNQLETPDYLDNLLLEDLRALNLRLETKFNVADGLLRQEFGLPFIMVRTAYHSRLVQTMLGKHEAAGHDVSKLKQTDIDSLDITNSLLDFGAEHLELQALAHLSMRHIGRAEVESQRVLSKLNKKMEAVVFAHFAHKGAGWQTKFNLAIDNAYTQEAFDWMIERDENNEPTGRFKPRYAETEIENLEKAFKKVWSDTLNKEIYETSNKEIISALTKGKPSSFLNSVEQKNLIDILARFRDVYVKGFNALSASEERTLSEDTNKIRRFWAKMEVKKKDSPLFEDINFTMKANAEHSHEYNLAKAKKEFYDYIYDMSSELMLSNDNVNYSLERAMMPQVGIQVMEAINKLPDGWRGKLRDGWKKGWSVFFNDNKIDAIATRTHDGLLIDNVDFASFKTSSKVPLRTIAPIKDFSANGSTKIYDILRYHFSNQINAKHLSPLLSDFHAIYTGLEQKGVDSNDKDFVKTKAFIEQFAEQFILSKTTEWNRSKPAKIIGLLKNVTILQMLGLNPATSAINLLQGLSEDAKMFVGKYGYEKGIEMMGTGFKRMFGSDLSNMDTIFFDKKAFAVLEHFGVETFTKSEIDRFNGWTGKIQDVMMIMQSKGESIIWGIGLLGQMSQQDWDNFYMNENGQLMIIKGSMNKNNGLLDYHPLFEHKYNVGSFQGKYFGGGRRLFKNIPIVNEAMVFKGWIWDYFRIRLQSKKINMFSKEEEGYQRGAARIAFNKVHAMFSENERKLQAMSGQDKLSDLDKQSLRMMAYDAFLGAVLFLIYSASGGDDKKENAYQKYVAKVASQMFLTMYPAGVLKMIERPFATLHDITVANKVLKEAITADPQGMGDAMNSLLPKIFKMESEPEGN